jgi:hypothetical protein
VARFANLSVALFIMGAVGGGSTRAAQTAEQGVSVGGVNCVLIKPAKPRASIILLAGGSGRLGVTSDGAINQLTKNQLVRTRADYAARGLAVLVPDYGVDLSQAVAYMAAIKRPVTLAGTSRGTQRAAHGLAAGARPDRLVLTSGFLSDESGDSDNAVNTLGSPSLLPPTLVVHHRHDGCRKTLPEGVDPFIAWSQGKARVVWLDGGEDDGDGCEAMAHHGFNGLDGRVVSVVAAFALR